MLHKSLQTTLHRKNFVQCCLSTLDDNIARVKALSKRIQTILHMKNPVHCYNTLGTLYRQKPCGMFLKRHQTTLNRKNSVQSRLWITSLFGNFYSELVNFLLITICCKCHANIAQIFQTLHQKNRAPILNKKTRL